MATTTTYVNTTHTTAAGSKTVTGTPAVGDLIIIAVAESGLANGLSGFAPTDNNPDGLGAYTQVSGALAQTAANTDQVAFHVRNALIGASGAVSTVFTAPLSASNTGGGQSVWRVSGMSRAGLTAILQAATPQSGGSGTPTLSFSSALSGGPVIGALTANQASANVITPPSGFTEDAEATYTTPSRVLEVVHLNSGASGTSLTWGAAVGATFGAVAIELDTSAAGTNGSGSGAVGTDTLSSPTGAGSGAGNAAAAPGTDAMSAPSGVASADGHASGGTGSIAASAPAGASSGAANGSAGLGTTNVSAATGAAIGTGSASGSAGAVASSGPAGTAAGDGSAAAGISTVTMSAPTGVASTAGAGSGSGDVGTVGLNAPAGSAAGQGTAIGSLTSSTMSAATGQASGDGSGASGSNVVQLFAPDGQAAGGSGTPIPPNTPSSRLLVGSESSRRAGGPLSSRRIAPDLQRRRAAG